MVNNVTVLGSLNVDTILRIARLPKPGETMPMSDKNNAGGGKGANQAIAAARCGASTAFIGKIGDDENGKMMLGLLNESNVSTEYVETSSEGTGQAFILLQDSGENSILIYGGANQTISDEDIENAREVICSADFLVTQFETPILPAAKAFEMSVGITSYCAISSGFIQMRSEYVPPSSMTSPTPSTRSRLHTIPFSAIPTNPLTSSKQPSRRSDICPSVASSGTRESPTGGIIRNMPTCRPR